MSWTSVYVNSCCTLLFKKKVGDAGVTQLVRPPENPAVVGTRRELPRCCLRPGGVKILYKRLNAESVVAEPSITRKITQRVLRFSTWRFGAPRVDFSLAK